MDLHPTPAPDSEAWDPLVRSFAHSHVLQSWAWGNHKSAFGWEPFRVVWSSSGSSPLAAAQILSRTQRLFGMRFTVLYVPKGPLLDWRDPDLVGGVVRGLEGLARRQGTIMIKLDPDLPRSFGSGAEVAVRRHTPGLRAIDILRRRGWVESSEAVQFRNTMVIDVTRGEDAILADMKQKTRYNIRLASRRGVAVRRGGAADLGLLYRMYAETSQRDDFVIRGEDYYRSAWGRFVAKDIARPLIAEVDEQPVAAVIPFAFGHKAWYLYGMSLNAHREKMPNYLLQWEAIRWAIEQGCTEYDLWGAPDEFNDTDPMWGVYRFKSGFGAQVVRTIGPWDWSPRPLLYFLYTRVMPIVLSAMRSRGRSRTAMDLEG